MNFDHPDAFDTDLLVAHLCELKAGRAVAKPVYNFVTSRREARTVPVNPGDLILLEGILVLHLEPLADEDGRPDLRRRRGRRPDHPPADP